MRIALIGGSFNPPHLGHLLLAARVLATHEPSEVWLAPVVSHAFGKPLAAFEDRFAMTELAVASVAGGGTPRLVASRAEQDAARAGSTGTTVELLRFLRAKRPGDELLLVVGADILLEKHRWANFDEVERLAKLVVVNRAGHPTVPGGGVPLPEISSTVLRERLGKGEPVPDLVPAAVERYLRAKQLYATPDSKR
jgi:nicotinate-nucleotide adenylyltransferase